MNIGSIGILICFAFYSVLILLLLHKINYYNLRLKELDAYIEEEKRLLEDMRMSPSPWFIERVRAYEEKELNLIRALAGLPLIPKTKDN